MTLEEAELLLSQATDSFQAFRVRTDAQLRLDKILGQLYIDYAHALPILRSDVDPSLLLPKLEFVLEP